MAYEVLARKWRPQQFDDVVGQSHVTQTLKNAITSKRVAHAYLFVGPRGTGKTTTARILAKALDCEKGPTVRPCNECDACREIMAGTYLDVMEIDGASHTGVDHIRELRENVKFAPASGSFKIYIIDEVHMLSSGAFNALLKTLEEPPAHVKFLFATTEPQKIPATILSRCQRFDLRRLSAREIIEHLRNICTAEEVVIEDAALLAIARGAEGGMRDAQSALDQLIAFRGKTITEQDALSVFGLVAQKTLEDLVEAVLKGDTARVLDSVAGLDGAGKDMSRLVLELIEYFRNLLIVLCAGPSSAALELADTEVARLKQLAAASDSGKVLRMVGHLTDAADRMRYALSKRTLVEVALIRACRAASVASIDIILKELNQLKDALGVERAAGGPAAEKKTPEVTERPSRPAPSAAPMEGAAPVPAPQKDPPGKDETARLTETWHEIVANVGHAAPLARNYLLDAKPVSVEGELVSIGFDPEFADSKTKIDFPRNVKAVEHALSQALGRTVRVVFSVLNARDTLPGDTKFERREGTEQAVARTTDSKAQRHAAAAKKEWISEPAVRKTLEMFHGDIVDIRE